MKGCMKSTWMKKVWTPEVKNAPKKRDFVVKNFQKVSKNAFFDLFFQNLACGAASLVKMGTKQCFGRARKINLVELKKGRQNFRNFFENPPLPLEKILDPPLTHGII